MKSVAIGKRAHTVGRERAEDDDRLLPDHAVQEVEEPQVRPRPVGVPGLGLAADAKPWRGDSPTGIEALR